jgi:hypothetical protein
MSIVALLAVLGTNEDLFDLRNPVRRRLAVGLLRDGPFMEKRVDGDD